MGGAPGRSGRNAPPAGNGDIDELGGNDQRLMHPGDVFIIKTPGGGG